MNEFVTAVSTLGFPIVAFAICAWFLKYVYDKSLAQFDKSLEKLGDLTQAVNHNSEVLSDLVKEVSRYDWNGAGSQGDGIRQS